MVENYANDYLLQILIFVSAYTITARIALIRIQARYFPERKFLV